MTQQISSHIVENPVTQSVCAVQGDKVISERVAGTLQSHKIRKIIKNNSVEYFCNECNTHYSQLNWVKEDHPGIDVKKFSVVDLRKEEK